MSNASRPDPAADAPFHGLLAVVAGYVAGCLATVLAFVAAAIVTSGGDLPPSGSIRMIGAAFGIVLGMAWPGFILFRLLLYWARRKDWFSFVIAGGLSSVVTGVVMSILDRISGTGPEVGSQWGPYLTLCALGMVAGLACWCCERWVRRVLQQGRAPARDG